MSEPEEIHVSDDPYRPVAAQIRDQLVDQFGADRTMTLLTIVMGNIMGNIVADGKLEPFVTEVGLSIHREALATMAVRDMARADQAGRQ